MSGWRHTKNAVSSDMLVEVQADLKSTDPADERLPNVKRCVSLTSPR